MFDRILATALLAIIAGFFAIMASQPVGVWHAGIGTWAGIAFAAYLLGPTVRPLARVIRKGA